MAAYLILGAGKFGCLALERLARQDAAATFHGGGSPAGGPGRGPGPGDTRVAGTAAEAAAFLAGNLAEDSPWDWLIPMVPVHLAWAWLLAGPLRGWEPAAAPAKPGRSGAGGLARPGGPVVFEPGRPSLPG